MSNERSPFNPLHNVNRIFSLPSPGVDTQQPSAFRLPREIRRAALHDTRAYLWTLEQLGGRIPVRTHVHDREKDIDLDNVALPADTLEVAAQLAAHLYERVLEEHIDPYLASTDARIHSFKIGEGSLDDKATFLNSVRRLIPQLLDWKTPRALHPSARLTAEETILLAILSLPSKPFNDRKPQRGEKKPRTIAKELLKEKFRYGYRIFRKYPELFNGKREEDSTPASSTGQYL